MIPVKESWLLFLPKDGYWWRIEKGLHMNTGKKNSCQLEIG
jgi:hypothetical protein